MVVMSVLPWNKTNLRKLQFTEIWGGIGRWGDSSNFHPIYEERLIYTFAWSTAVNSVAEVG